MPIPTLTEFWDLLARSGLVESGALAALRAEHDANPAACGGPDAMHVAHWLLGRGVLTRWQAKRLSRGNHGPFFLGDYRLLERHDRVGDELTFTGRHEPSGRIVTVVLLSAKRVKRLDIWTAIVQRTTAANATTDPMLSRTWSLEQDRGNRFIVCEVITGTSLADELERAGPMPATQAGVLVAQVARAIADLHARGAVHGDLSLDTLVREPAPGGGERIGRVRLLQFPLAGDPHRVPLRPWQTDNEMRRLGRRAAFVSPEMLHPESIADQRGDVYSIGAILYALVSGASPCWEGDADKTLRKAAFDGPRPLGPPQVSPEIAALVGYLMAPDPAKRYQTAAEAANAISMCLGLPAAVQPVPQAAAPVGNAPAAVEPSMPSAGIDASNMPFLAPTSLPQSAAATNVSTSAAGVQKGVESAAARSRRRRALGLQLVGGSITLGLVAGVVALVMSRIDFESPAQVPPRVPPRRVARDAPPVAQPPSPPTNGNPAVVSAPAGTVESSAPEEPATRAARQVIVADESLPWASPTEGSPPRLAYLPPGSQLVLIARPADLVADEEGSLVLKSLGPVVDVALARIAEFCGCEVADIEVIQAGWQAGEADEVLAGYAVRLVAGRKVVEDEAARRTAWGQTTPQDVAGETIHSGKPFSFWVPSAEEGRVLVIASEAAIATAALAVPGGPAARETFLASIVKQSLEAHKRPRDMLRADLPLELEALVDMLDESRHVTLFGSPHYLLNRGRAVLAGPLAKLTDPLRRLFGETMRGAAVSAHFKATTYLELDAIAERDPPARVYAPQLAKEVESLAAGVEEYCAMLSPSPYGRVLVMRLPAMLRVLVANMRVGVEGNGIVINAYLPQHAGHNLALAAELALAQSPGGGATAAPSGPVPQAPVDAQGKLQKKITIVFAKDTLEMAIQMVSDEVGVPMEILGPDLQLDGITQNQSFGLDIRDQSAEAVLQTILTKANPDGKLVYVIRNDGGSEKLFITTRAAVEKRQETLPPAFQRGSPQEIRNP